MPAAVGSRTQTLQKVNVSWPYIPIEETGIYLNL